MGMPAAQSMMSRVQGRPGAGSQASMQGMMQMIQQMQQRGLFSRPYGFAPEQGANRFLHAGNAQMPRQPIPQGLGQVRPRMMPTRPQPMGGGMPGLFNGGGAPGQAPNPAAWAPPMDAHTFSAMHGGGA